MHTFKQRPKARRMVLTGALVLLVFFGFLYAQLTSAATYTWDNDGGDNLWSTCTNWSSDICPGGGDVARFTSTVTDDAIIDTDFAGSVQGIQIDVGYTGTITQQRNLAIGSASYTQADGTFNQGTNSFDLNNGSFTLNGGTFTTGVGTSNIQRNFFIDGSATYTSSSSRLWVFDADGNGDSTVFNIPGTFSGIVDIQKSRLDSSFTLASGVINNMADMTSNVSSISINDGTTMNVANNLLNASNLTISGQLFASSTIDLRVSFTLNSTGEFIYDASTIFIARNYTDNGGDFDESGITFVFDTVNSNESTVFNFPGIFPGIVDIDKRRPDASFILASGSIVNTADMTSNSCNVVINNGTTMRIGSNLFNADSLNVSGQLFASTTIALSGSFTLNDTGEFFYDPSSITIANNYTDNGGTFDESGITFVFNSTNSGDSTTFTFPGTFPGIIDISKNRGDVSFVLSDGVVANMADSSTNSGGVVINGSLATNGNDLSANAFTINPTGTLRLYGTETITTPTINAGGTVDYYGPSTYSAINDWSYHNLSFSDGTYTIAADINVAGNFTNSGAVFNQTSGTTTFTGTANTISGNNMFFNLAKTTITPATLTFAAGDTQTITGDLTLTGLDGSNRLALESTSPGTQWRIDPQGERTLDLLTVTDGNSINVAIVNCYDVDCVDGGNNTNIFFVPPLPTYRLQGGVRLRGGTRI